MTNSEPKYIRWLLRFQTHLHHLPGYMFRYWLFKKRSKDKIQIRLHGILRSDLDRHLHDHPWWYVTMILSGGYWEVTFQEHTEGLSYNTLYVCNLFKKKWYGPGSILFRKARSQHKLEIPHGKTCWTLFICGPKSRMWGFITERGWKHWRIYLEETGQKEMLAVEESDG